MADNVTTDDLEKALQQLAEGMGLSVKEYVEAGFLDKTTYGQDKAAILARLDAIDAVNAEDDIDSLAEKVIAINKVLSNDDGALQGILDLIKVNTTDIQTLQTTTEGLRTDLDAATAKNASNESAISALADEVKANKAAAEDAGSKVQETLTAQEDAIAKLNADADTEGSIANAVKAEELRTKATIGSTADLTTDDKTNIVGAINEINAANQANSEKIDILNGDENTEGSIAKAVKDATGGDISGLTDRVSTLEEEKTRVASILDDTTDEDDNLVKGIVSQTADNAAAIAKEKADRIAALEKTVEDMKAYSDSNDLKASSMNIDALTNKFRSALGLPDNSSDDSSDDGL